MLWSLNVSACVWMCDMRLFLDEVIRGNYNATVSTASSASLCYSSCGAIQKKGCSVKEERKKKNTHLFLTMIHITLTLEYKQDARESHIAAGQRMKERGSWGKFWEGQRKTQKEMTENKLFSVLSIIITVNVPCMCADLLYAGYSRMPSSVISN